MARLENPTASQLFRLICHGPDDHMLRVRFDPGWAREVPDGLLTGPGTIRVVDVGGLRSHEVIGHCFSSFWSVADALCGRWLDQPRGWRRCGGDADVDQDPC
jgi:hypothetical protein